MKTKVNTTTKVNTMTTVNNVALFDITLKPHLPTMSKRAHEDEPSLSRTRHRAGSPTREGTSVASFLPSELLSQSIGSFLDSPFDTLSRRVQQDRRAAAFRAHARAAHVAPPIAAAHGAEEERAFLRRHALPDMTLASMLRFAAAPIGARARQIAALRAYGRAVHVAHGAEEARALLIRHALPDMTTTDMRRFFTARVIRALTRFVYVTRGSICISILPLSAYTEKLPENPIQDVAHAYPHVIIDVGVGGWLIHYPFPDDEDLTLPEPDLTEARLARFIPFIYPPPHDRTEEGELAGLAISMEDAELKSVPHEGLADAIALFLGHIIRPGHVVAAISHKEFKFCVYDVQTNNWHRV